MDYAQERQRLVERLVRQGHLHDPRVHQAMLDVPRERFVPRYLTHRAYEDAPIPIGHGQTISAPHMVAIMTEALRVEPGQRVLEVGAGSGYQAAILGRLVEPDGRVTSVERIGALARRAREAIADSGVHNVDVVEGDGSQGWVSSAPYDRIIVTAAAPRIPSPLTDQLAVDGILLVPVGERTCTLTRVQRDGPELRSEALGACAFVPLRGAFGQETAPFGS